MIKNEDLMLYSAAVNSLSQYYMEGLWRCLSSPSGAHHWLIEYSGWGECKYCKRRRRFPRALNGDEYWWVIGETMVGEGLLSVGLRSKPLL